MASTIFRVSRTEQEGQPSGAATLNRAQDPLKMKIYDTKEDIDISDLAVNEVVATVEEEPLANIHITDIVEDGNMNPVTSNAVADAVIDIKDYTKDYVDAKNSYSTTETLTGGTWIDGKPIYRKVVQVETFTSSSPLSVSITDLDTLVDIKFKRNYDSSHPTWWVLGDGTSSVNNLYIKQSTDTIIIEPVSTSITIKNFTGIIEYTKTTD